MAGPRKGRPRGGHPPGKGGPPGRRPPGRGRRPSARRVPQPPPDRRPPAGLRLADVDEIEVEVTKLVTGGDGLARFEGIPVFIPRSAPGDRLRVRLVERRVDYGRAEIVEVLSGGPGRREPPCPYFARCGGCDLQHLGEDFQLRYKVEAVRETLQRLGGIEAPGEVSVVPGEPWGYRMRTQLQVGENERGRAVGYFARRSHELVAVDRCPVLVEELERRLQHLPRALRETTLRRLDVAVGQGEAWSVAPVVEGLPRGELSVDIGDFSYAFDARCFFQGHRQLLPKLVEATIGEEARDGELAVDLYAGVGLFTLPLACRAERVVAVEGDRVAARYARTNARRNKLANVEVEALAVDGWLRRRENRDLRPGRVVADPPREGLSMAVRRWLREARPPRLTYVSCQAATLARDLGKLKGVYRLRSLALLDMFPQTGHMELVAQLEAVAPPGDAE